MALARRGARAAPAAVGGGAAAARVLVVGDEGVGKTAFVETIATGGGGGGHAVALSDLTRTVGASVRCVAIGGNDAAVAAESGDAPAIIELWDVGGDRSRAQLRKTFYERVAGVVYVWDAKRPRTRGALREWASDIARHASFDRGGAVHPPASTPNNGSDMHEHAYASELEQMLAGDMGGSSATPVNPSGSPLVAHPLPSAEDGGGGGGGGGGVLPQLPVPTLVVAAKCDAERDARDVPATDARASAKNGRFDADVWGAFMREVTASSGAGRVFQGF